jgi:EAL domain-containing protein (putative c-di-GMP-specific phosphodiesterase class I)
MDIAKQPIIDINSKKLFAYEILARNKNLHEFTPPPPRHMFWSAIDLQALSMADRLMTDEPHIIINISEPTLADDGLFARWEQAAKSRTRKNTLSVEITEQVTDNTLANRWKQLRALGIKLVMDDFGVEHSTLARLQRYPWDICKFEVDRPDGFSDSQLIGIEKCKELGIEMVAERIENRQQAKAAHDAGLFLQQGFLWAKPEIVLSHEDERISA